VYTDNESITQNSVDDQLQVTFQARITSYSGAAGNEPLMKLELYQGANFVPVKSNNVFPMYESSQFTTYTVLFDLPATAVDYQLRLYSYPRTSGNYVSFNFEFDNFVWVPIYADGEDLTFDRFYGVNNTDSVFTDVFEGEVFFGDSAQDNDIGSFQISSTRTETWNRYGKTENQNIQVLHGQNIIENFGRYKDYVRCTIFDPKHNIEPYSLLEIDSKFYQVVASTEIFGGGARREIECEMVEVLNAAVGTALVSQSLTSVDGNSTQSSTDLILAAGVSIDDSSTNTSSTWSSSKIASETTLQGVTDNGSTTTVEIVVGGIFTTKGTATGATNQAYARFKDSADTSQGYVGFAATGNSDLFINNSITGGKIRLRSESTDVLTVDDVQNVGIGDTTPSYKLDVNGTGRFVQDLTTDADMTANSFATTNVDIEVGGSYIIDATGTVNATDFRATSDITKKKDLKPIQGAVTLLEKITGFAFKWKGDDKKDFGVIAQLVEQILPEIVTVDNNGIYSVNYNSFIAILIQAIKELNERIKRLEA
jgi:hypothetical protein